MPYVKDTGGLCPLCSQRAPFLEGHHVCYDPEKKIRICHECHFTIHHFPSRLSEAQKRLLKTFIPPDCKRTFRI